MASFFQTLSDVFSAFGAAVFVPVILFIIAKCMGVTGKKAFNTALLCAVGLTGFNLVINSYSAIIAPVVNQMVTNAGVNLPTLDTGWQSTSVIAYSTKVGLIFIGLVVGALIGIIGNFNALVGEGALTAWGTVSSAAVSTAAIMAVFPKVAGIFASAFTTLTDAYKSKAAKSGEGREWYLSVNDACGYGEPNTLVTGILLIPIMLVVAFILPGNTILPMADLCALPYMVEVFVCVSNGNIAKSVVSGAIWFSLGLVVASVLAPTFTQVAVDAGFQLAQEGVYIISFGIMCHPLIAGLFYAFWSQNPIIIGAVVIAYFVLYFLFKKNKERFVGYLENAAAAYSAY